MTDVLLGDTLILALAGLIAGLVDAIVGGGGLIQLPAMFSVLTQTVPASLFGTNKFASVWGTLFAARTYAKRLSVEWGTALPAALSAFLFSMAGAWLVTHTSPDLIRKSLPFVLLLVAIYVAARKDFGATHAPRYSGALEIGMALMVGAIIGFYDGFFGPGTGSFLLFLFVRLFGFDFLGASAVAKIVNVACNFSALLWFGYSGHILWQLGLVMAVSNIVGAVIGTRLAIKGGSALVRQLFLVVVSLLILKTAKDAFWP